MDDHGSDPGAFGPPDDAAGDAELRTFLIADVRGYTSFTQRYGDEAAAKLAAKFARVAREVVEQGQGRLLELRGDEALCVFLSPRQAVRCAIALQRRFVDETATDPALPLPVGIGIDVGEAVPVEGGYRSGALNLAARLCSIALPGETLVSPELAHLARRVDGMSYVPRDPVRLKGLPDPVRPQRVVPEGEDPVAQLVALKALPPKPTTGGPRWLPGWLRDRPGLALTVGAIVLVLIAAAVFRVVGSGSGSSLASLDENVVGVIDRDSADLVAQTAIAGSPSGVAVSADAVWVTDIESGTVSRVDRPTGVVTQRTDVGQSPTGVLVAAGSVWVANSGDGTVSQLDLDGQPLQEIDVGNTPTALAYDGGTVWVVDTGAGAIYGLDPESGDVHRLAVVGGSPTGIAAANGHLWVSISLTGAVVDVDEVSGKILQSLSVGNDPRGVAVSGSSVWVANNLDGTVTHLDALTGDTLKLPVGDGPVAVVATSDAAWVASSDSRQVTEIDAKTNQVVARTPTGSRPTALALAGDEVWVAAGSNPSLHRGGTMAVTVTQRVQLDPVRGYDLTSEPVNAMLYDGLLSFRREVGAAGGVVVPDLAQALPTVSGDGLTFTFRLRPNLVWSTGEPITGADIRHGLERAVASNVTSLYGGILGANECTAKQCDLSHGIEVDETAHTVEIHLAAPDPEFLYKLAVPTAPAAPSDAPLGALGKFQLPSTGPYQVAEHTNSRVILERNQQFREWSSAAQPAGYPDRIEITRADPEATPFAATDWATNLTPPHPGAFRARYGDRMRINTSAGTWYVFLNTTVPPFDNVLARRAVAYAIDRAAVVDGWFVPGQVACTMLPPSVPGHQSYCPYTLHAGADETWQAPDVRKALNLVRRSGTRGAQVSVYAGVVFPGMQAVVTGLKSIGYRAKLVAIGLPFNDNLAKVHAPQAGLAGWIADYPAASNFLQSQFACGVSTNVENFCDRHISAQMNAALQLQIEEPAAASDRWAAIDRELVDAAPMIPLVNPVDVDLVSERLQHAERNTALGPLYDQAWVR